jgi:predicted AAA+ superfamily ATPase
MIIRNSVKSLKKLVGIFKIVAVTGPRQSGKTTLVRSTYPQRQYINLEDPEIRSFAIEDPKTFLSQLTDGVIIDEAQRVPELFSYIQMIVDENKNPGQFILTGSNNFLLNQNISQSLAGRISYINLLPFSFSELSKLNVVYSSNELILSGMYPPVFDQKIPPEIWYPSYVQTYIERDVRQIKNVGNLLVFEKFLKLLAGRTGQELNYSSLAVETGVDFKTIQSWIGILESSFIIHLLKPFYKNYNKTIVKRPKVYFIDTGLVCSLLGITKIFHLETHPLRGALFETFVISEIIKQKLEGISNHQFYFWRDKTGREIDLIIENALSLLPIEIKSGQTFQKDFIKHLIYWMKLTEINQAKVLYDGSVHQKRSDGIEILNWKEFLLNRT